MRKNLYREYTEKRQKEVNDFPMFFAFNDKQFEEGMQKLGFENMDNLKDKIIGLSCGGYIRKSDKDSYLKLINGCHDSLKEFLKDDNNLYDAFIYELSNHEFCITYDYEPALSVLNMDIDSLTDKQKEILLKAKKDYLAQVD